MANVKIHSVLFRLKEIIMSRNRKKKRRVDYKLPILFTLLVVVLGIVIFIKSAVYGKKTFEAGTEITVDDLCRRSSSGAEITSKSDEIDTSVPGKYTVYVKKGLFTYKCKVTIKDTIAPVAQGKTHYIYYNETCEAEDLVSTIVDATHVTVSYASTPDFTKVGDQDVAVTLTDEGGNTTTVSSVLSIIPVIGEVTINTGDPIPSVDEFAIGGNNKELVINSDIDTSVPKKYTVRVKVDGYVYESILNVLDNEAPVITAPTNIYYFIGDTISYRNNVTVVDNSGEDANITIDDSKVNLNVVGEYEVTITATDASGNTSTKTVGVVVAEKIYDVDTVYEYADRVLSNIFWDGMSDYEKLWAIYEYVYYNVGYIDHSEKIDWVQGAYEGLVNRAGDCWVYACTTKVLLDRAGIVNMDINKIPTDTRHYWNLVDIGEGWHHLDTTPRVDGPTIFYWDEATMMEYSRNHNDSHNYDHSAYPQVP